MSEQSESDKSIGFRSRQQQIKNRRQLRLKIMSQIQAKSSNKQQNVRLKKEQVKTTKFVSLIEFEKKQDSESELDMFADDIVVKDDKKGERQVTDEQGYYQIYQNKLIYKGKYQLIQKIGKGVFGVVAKVKDSYGKYYAIKVLRQNQTTTASGQRQYKILQSLNKCQYIMKCYDYFYEEGHLFLVFQLMSIDLRQYTRKYQDKIALQNIKQYAIWMFLSLHQLRKNNIIHADIKPDNYLFTQNYKSLKLSDFGTSFSVQQHSTDTEQMVARYYRAPQIILGCQMPKQQRFGIDTWAVGCSLFQLFTGKFLFDGNSNNDMIKQMIQTKGRFSIKMLKKCKFIQKYFDGQFNFLHKCFDNNTKEYVIRKTQPIITPERQLLAQLRKHSRFEQDPKILSNFKDFLQNCLALNPKNRLTPQTAFQHPFLNYQIKLS